MMHGLLPLLLLLLLLHLHHALQILHPLLHFNKLPVLWLLRGDIHMLNAVRLPGNRDVQRIA